MVAIYPVSVHTYTAHRDAVDYILADHVNSLQDEITAIEQTLGTHPTTWTYTGDPNFASLPDISQQTSWATVRDRLDALQAHVARLDRITAGLRVTTLPGSTHFPPVTVVRNPGQVFPPSTVQWTTYDMAVSDFDSSGMFTGGNSILCPQTGWWSITANAWTDVPVGDPATTHVVSNRLLLGNSEVASHSSQLPWGSPVPHRVNLTYDGPWQAGQPAFLQGQHYPSPGSASVTSNMLISATYVRETV